MKIYNLLFLVFRRDEYFLLKDKIEMDFSWFSLLEPRITTKHVLFFNGFIPEPEGDRLFFHSIKGFIHSPWKFYRQVRKDKPEVFFIHGLIFPVQTLLLKLFKPRNSVVVIQHHSEKPFRNPVKRWFQKQAYSWADAYLFTSRELAEPFLKCGIIGRAERIYEVMEVSTRFTGGNKAEARRALNAGAAIIFLWVGRLNANKDPLTVLRAFRAFRELYSDFKLIMIYSEKDLENEVRDYAAINNLSGSIDFIGSLPHHKLEDWFNAADFFISASHYEGGGTALCEAMACGCVPVVSRIPSFIKMTDKGNCGLLFEPGNSHELFNKLCQARKMNWETESLKVLEQFNKELSHRAIASKAEAIFNSLRQDTGS